METSATGSNLLRLAIATDGDAVAGHFGHCQSYTIIDIAAGKVQKSELIANPGHEPGFLPGYLAERGVNCIVAGGMGARAQMLFAQHGIETIVGVAGTIEETVQAFLRGELESGESSCSHTCS
jgi:predicted Fe-Mo cluster-binding NifX family protein